MTEIFNKNKSLHVRRDLRKNSTEAERILWQRLRTFRDRGFAFRRQYGIGKYIVDFYCPNAHLVIEVDGDSHTQPGAQMNDRDRQSNIEALGLCVMRFTDHEVFDLLDDVMKRIAERLSLP
jgi:very-short-patch-repair endonuclease